MTRKVKVRIAVSVDENGEWCALGWPGNDDHAENREHVEFGAYLRDYWVTAELEVPDIAEIQGEVREAREGEA